MFGYVTADLSLLDEAQKLRYRSFYCGLCRTLKTKYGLAAEASLTYELTFLAMLLSSLYEPEERSGVTLCLPHPGKKHPTVQTVYTEYAAAMNVILACEKCRDDWKDEKKFSRRMAASLLSPPRRRAAEAYPRQAEVISGRLAALAELEASRCCSPDEAAAQFGAITAELFDYDPVSRWSGLLRRLGDHLGRAIYLMDAVLDYPEDAARGRWNPFGDRFPADPEQLLAMHLGVCTDALDRLPLVQDAGILRNVLYAGIWIPYRRKTEKQKEKE